METDCRKEVINICLDLFIEKGLTTTSTSYLSSALKLQNAELYYYFESKDDAVVACAEEAARKAAEEEERRKAEEAARKAAEEAEKAKQQVVVSIHMLKREKTGEIISINKSPFKIGRSNSADDYVIADNRSISRTHATLVIKNDVCYITDNGSLNKTYINGSALVPETECALSNGDNVKLYNERFVYLKYHN